MVAAPTDATAVATSGRKGCKAVKNNTASNAPATNSPTLVLHRLTARMSGRIEYEIPPLRAIYIAEAGPCTFAEACEQVKTEQPLWHIRNMKRLNAKLRDAGREASEQH